MTATTYEYAVQAFGLTEEAEAWLNGRALEGWRLVHVIPGWAGYPSYTMERALTPRSLPAPRQFPDDEPER